MKIAITGASGFIGKFLTREFAAAGHHLTLFTRQPLLTEANQKLSIWDPDRGFIEPKDLDGINVLIHLAGAGIADARWTAERKKVLLDSRVKSTELLSLTLSRLNNPPSVFFSSSATGYYGNRSPEEEVNEESAPGRGFLADLCNRWEEAAISAERPGIRVVRMRLGVALAPTSGALAKMLPLFRKGLGGKLGSGKQIMSWISIEDIPRAILHIIETPKLSGAVNFVAPQAVSNAVYTRTLADVLHRPAFLTAWPFALKFAYGEMAEEMLLAGARVVPRKFLEAGFSFKYPDLRKTLAALHL